MICVSKKWLRHFFDTLAVAAVNGGNRKTA